MLVNLLRDLKKGGEENKGVTGQSRSHFHNVNVLPDFLVWFDKNPQLAWPFNITSKNAQVGKGKSSEMKTKLLNPFRGLAVHCTI